MAVHLIYWYRDFQDCPGSQNEVNASTHLNILKEPSYQEHRVCILSSQNFQVSKSTIFTFHKHKNHNFGYNTLYFNYTLKYFTKFSKLLLFEYDLEENFSFSTTKFHI